MMLVRIRIRNRITIGSQKTDSSHNCLSCQAFEAMTTFKRFRSDLA